MTLPQIELIVRAVVAEGSRLLLAQPTGEAWYFLPGGHVEPGEPVAIALRRELEEELGIHDVRIGGVLAISENRYTDERGDHHEVNLLHRVAVREVIDGSREAHIGFRWVERSEFDDVEIRPASIADLLRSGIPGPEIAVRTDGFP
jgi:ADP-ribose pyrophosphatase YjhB (NUDIX family)